MSEEPGSARRDSLIALAIAGLTLATVVVGALAPPPAHEAAPTAAMPPERDPGCLEWGDGCHVCRRLPEGNACSLPGIACTPGPTACLRHAQIP